ncbi:hypothetical protein PIB30_010678 [Stylosanthes scabra]|uniref:Uncharacterized protein n=1 Tax=Stylosanthes scabra TaxID=79078 RepID=A0ABU6W5F6_9FABA|nr:hypothetical protein [Stylosanthes scabra]
MFRVQILLDAYQVLKWPFKISTTSLSPPGPFLHRRRRRCYVDGLARTKASRAADADIAACLCCGCICNWILYGFFPNDDPHIFWWCGSHYTRDRP